MGQSLCCWSCALHTLAFSFLLACIVVRMLQSVRLIWPQNGAACAQLFSSNYHATVMEYGKILVTLKYLNACSISVRYNFYVFAGLWCSHCKHSAGMPVSFYFLVRARVWYVSLGLYSIVSLSPLSINRICWLEVNLCQQNCRQCRGLLSCLCITCHSVTVKM